MPGRIRGQPGIGGSSAFADVAVVMTLRVEVRYLEPPASPHLFGGGHAFWKPYPRFMSVWTRHMLPRLSGPGPACHSHGPPDCAAYV